MSSPPWSAWAERLPDRLRHPPRGLVRLARWMALAAVVAVVAQVGVDSASSVRRVHLRVDAPWLVPAAAASLLAGLVMPLGWRELIRAYGPVVGLRATLRLWWTSQMARFVPSGAAAVATRVALAGREGVPRVLAGASLPIEVGVVVGWGTVLSGALLPSSVVPAWARLAMAAGGAGALGAMPAVLWAAGRWVPRLPRPLAGRTGWQRIYRSEAVYGLNSLVRTAAFVLLARGLVPGTGGRLGLLGGAFNAGAVAGLVSIAPGGLGVREGIMTLVLRQRFGFGDAAALAVALRAWDLAVDVVWVSGARLAALRRRPGPPPAAPAAGPTPGPPRPASAEPGRTPGPGGSPSR